MLLRVDLPEGPFLADVGFGNQTPTAPLEFRPMEEQTNAARIHAAVPGGGELTFQAEGTERDGQEHLPAVAASRLPVDFEVANWFTATHPASPFVSHLIVARPGRMRRVTRCSMAGSRCVARKAGWSGSCWIGRAEFLTALKDRFGRDADRWRPGRGAGDPGPKRHA